MNISLFYDLDSIYSPKLNYLVITLIIVIISQVLEKNRAKGIRDRIASKQRETYYTRLKKEAAIMGERASVKEQELSDDIEQLEQESEKLRSQLSKSDNSDDEDTSEASFDERVSHHRHELAELKGSARELESVEESINRMSTDLSDSDTRLEDKISQLESDNEQLRAQIEDFKADQMKSSLLMSNTNLNPEILNYLEAHAEDLTLDFLKTAQETLLEIKALHPDMNFNDYINKLKNSQENYNSSLNELQISEKNFELKYKLYKKKYEDELSSFDEVRVDHILKNNGTKHLLDSLRERNKIKEETVKDLRNELSQRKNEIDKLRKKFQEAEEQWHFYYKAWKETSNKLEQLEIENKASRERDRRLLNVSSPSSMLENRVPSPPPVDVPSIDELLQSHDNQNSHYSLDGSIPPPPPIQSFSSYNFN